MGTVSFRLLRRGDASLRNADASPRPLQGSTACPGNPQAGGPGPNHPLKRAEPSLRARALRMLARREHSREELRRKLDPHLVEGDNVEAVLDDFTQRGWLSDARFAEHSIRAKAGRFGPLKVAQHLRQCGVDEEAIAAGFHAAGAEGIASIEAVWKSRFRERPADDRELGRQVRFLQGRGFTIHDILHFLKEER
jgi:regulatory protein